MERLLEHARSQMAGHRVMPPRLSTMQWASVKTTAIPSMLRCEKKSLGSSANTKELRRPKEKPAPGSSLFKLHEPPRLMILLGKVRSNITRLGTTHSRKFGAFIPKSSVLKLSGRVIACMGAMLPSFGKSTSAALNACSKQCSHGCTA